MSHNDLRPPSVEPYLRGVAWPAGSGATYPRADPNDVGRLPADTWATACLPVGVRLEISGDATAVDIDYDAATDQLGHRGAGAGTTFTAWRDRVQVDEQPASVGPHRVRIALRGGSADNADRTVVHLPEGMRPSILGLTAVDGSIAPAARQPGWIAYGDSIAEGWIASGPAGAWPAIAARTHGLDVVNLGYAGSARGEIVSAQHVASIPADVISITHGTNCWTRIPHSAEQMHANTVAFLHLVRAGHAGVPIVVVSPIVRPDGEATPNALGATHADIRTAMEDATRSVIAEGDALITLLSGEPIVAPEQLADGVHPGDDGHAALARAIGAAVAGAISRRARPGP